MYDYVKLYIEDSKTIISILEHPKLEFIQGFNKRTGKIFMYSKIQGWEVMLHTPTLLEIRGSLHKFYTGGFNYNDFTYCEAVAAINLLCKLFNFDPSVARVVNLEFGVNIQPVINASDIIEQVICCCKKAPIRPYTTKPEYTYIEFETEEAYIKLYDKGKQYKTTNILRFEIKSKVNRYLAPCGVNTLADLLKTKTMALLGLKINEVFEKVVFQDDTIDLRALEAANKHDYKVYMRMRAQSEWVENKGKRTTANRDRERRFREIVEKYGKRKLYSIKDLINEKVMELCQDETTLKFRPEYSLKTNAPVLKTIVRINQVNTIKTKVARANLKLSKEFNTS